MTGRAVQLLNDEHKRLIAATAEKRLEDIERHLVLEGSDFFADLEALLRAARREAFRLKQEAAKGLSS